jgi:hypothetical protein
MKFWSDPSVHLCASVRVSHALLCDQAATISSSHQQNRLGRMFGATDFEAAWRSQGRPRSCRSTWKVWQDTRMDRHMDNERSIKQDYFRIVLIFASLSYCVATQN